MFKIKFSKEMESKVAKHFLVPKFLKRKYGKIN